MLAPSATTRGVAPLDATVSTSSLKLLRHAALICLDKFDDGVRARLSDPSPVGKIDAAHARLRGKRDELRVRRHVDRIPLCFSNSSTMLFPSGVSSAAEARAANAAHVGGGIRADGQECRRVPVAYGDRAGLIQQHDIDVAGQFHRLAALGDDVGLQGAVHARDADGGEQGADGGGNEADQKGNEGRHVGAQALQGFLDAQVAHHVLLGVPGHGPQGNHHDQKDQRKGREQQGQGDLVGRALADGAFDQGDHPVEERFAGAAGDLDTIRSERTTVPPVTPDRSPPASRMTGADSPVIADSSTEATPSIISPSPGIVCPACTTTRSPGFKAAEETSSMVPALFRR